jgi:hypothetical protein
MGGRFSRSNTAQDFNSQQAAAYARNQQATARNIIKLTNSNNLKSALKNYINAVNALNVKNNAHIYGALMQIKQGTNATYKNRLINGIGKVVASARRAMPAAAAAAVANNVPEVPPPPAGANIPQAVAAVNNATRQLKNLNNFMSGFTAGNTNTLVKYYINSGRNYFPNRNANLKRNNGPKYPELWEELARRAANGGIPMARSQQEEINVNAPYRQNKVKISRSLNNRTWKFVNKNLASTYTIQQSNSNNPIVAVRANVNAKSRAAANLAYKQAYGGLMGSGVTSGAWTVNQSVNNLTRNETLRNRFAGINKGVVFNELNKKSNQGQAIRAKRVINAILG